MGHQRLGDIPKTQKWNAIVSKVAGVGGTSGGGMQGGTALLDDLGSVASEVLEAAEQGLNAALNDAGLQFTFYTLTQLVLATRQPDNEPHLQEACDGLLLAADTDLTREYPLLKWGSNMTKPDWSSEELRLWVEAKYIRKKTDIAQINEAIAADITKYGDNKRRVLFVVYDPGHLLIDEAAFRSPIESRPEMMACIIR